MKGGESCGGSEQGILSVPSFSFGWKRLQPARPSLIFKERFKQSLAGKKKDAETGEEQPRNHLSQDLRNQRSSSRVGDRDFPGGPVVKNSPCNAGFDP